MDDIIRSLWKINLPNRRGLYLKRLLYRKFFGEKRIRTVTKYGVTMMLDPAEIVDGDIITEGYWEPEVLEAIQSRLKPGDTFWDIGGNLGTHSLTIKKLMPSVTVVAFEPNPIMNGLFEAAAKMNGLEIRLNKFGLSDKAGEAEFYVYTGLNYGKSGLHAPNEASVRTIKVELKTGDQLIEQDGFPAPHVIKIDIEGHELFAFRGMMNLLRGDTLRAIILEDTPDPESPVKLCLQKNGFRLKELSPPEYMSHTDYVDYVAEK